MSFFGGLTSKTQQRQKMTITRALVELKTIDKRIQKSIDEAVFVSTKGDLRKPDTRAEQAQSNYDRIRDLMERRVRIKSAIVSSNASTRVKVCGMDLTIAEAIELKSSINNYRNLLTRMRGQYGEANRTMEVENERARHNLENLIKKNDSEKEKDRDNINFSEYSKQYMKVHGVELFDPLRIQGRIEELDKFVTDFESEVDFLLSEKNATTQIEV